MDKQASNISNEIVSDMQLATFYPPSIVARPTVTEILDKVDGLLGRIQEARMQAELDSND